MIKLNLDSAMIVGWILNKNFLTKNLLMFADIYLVEGRGDGSEKSFFLQLPKNWFLQDNRILSVHIRLSKTQD